MIYIYNRMINKKLPLSNICYSMTKGNAIFVNVQKDMGKKVFEHFKRMALPPAQNPAFNFGGAKPLAIVRQQVGAKLHTAQVPGCHVGIQDP